MLYVFGFEKSIYNASTHPMNITGYSSTRLTLNELLFDNQDNFKALKKNKYPKCVTKG